MRAVRPLLAVRRPLCSAVARPLRPFLVERYEGWSSVDRGEADSLTSSEIEPLTLAELLSFPNEEERSEYEAISLGYTEQPGALSLRQAIADVHYETIRPDQVNVLAPQVHSAPCCCAAMLLDAGAARSRPAAARPLSFRRAST